MLFGIANHTKEQILLVVYSKKLDTNEPEYASWSYDSMVAGEWTESDGWKIDRATVMVQGQPVCVFLTDKDGQLVTGFENFYGMSIEANGKFLFHTKRGYEELTKNLAKRVAKA